MYQDSAVWPGTAGYDTGVMEQRKLPLSEAWS